MRERWEVGVGWGRWGDTHAAAAACVWRSSFKKGPRHTVTAEPALIAAALAAAGRGSSSSCRRLQALRPLLCPPLLLLLLLSSSSSVVLMQRWSPAGGAQRAEPGVFGPVNLTRVPGTLLVRRRVRFLPG